MEEASKNGAAPRSKEDSGKGGAPVRVVWSQFVRHVNETPLTIWSWPEDYLLQEWFIFQEYAKSGASY